MAVSDLTEEVPVKVFRSHVKIPVIFVLPAAVLASLYCVLYFYVNSNWFAERLPKILHNTMGGEFEVRELVVEPSLATVHVYGAEIAENASAEPAIEAPEAHASVAPVSLLAGNLVFDRGEAHGAEVNLTFDAENHLNLLKALGIADQPDTPTSSGGPPLDISFRSLRVTDTEFTMVREEFEFHVPDIDIEQASIDIPGDGGLEMRVPSVEFPTADFRFRRELFGFEPGRGDWRFEVEDIEVDNWHWRDDGFRADRVEFYTEGLRARAEGRMAFPNDPGDEAGMVYEGRARVSIPYWSPLAQYFIRDTVHFEVPALEVAVEGTLEFIDGRVRAHADVLETSGLRFTDVHGEAYLRNGSIYLKDGRADFYGGRIRAKWAYFDMFEVAYGGEASFSGVDPAALLREYDVDVPTLAGDLSGAARLHGAVPMGIEFDLDDPFPTRTNASRLLADATVTEEWVFEPRTSAGASLGRRAVLETGSQFQVDYERVAIPDAALRVAGSTVDVDHFEIDYNEGEFVSPTADPPVELTARVPDVGSLAARFGVEGLEGRATARIEGRGPVGAPTGRLRLQLAEAGVGRERVDFEGAEAELDASFEEGALTVHRGRLRSAIGNLDVDGRLDLARREEREGSVFWRLRPRKQADLEYEAEGVDMSAVDVFAGTGLGARGLLDAEGSVGGTIERPDVAFRASWPDGGVEGLDLASARLEGSASYDGIEIDRLDATVGESGRLEAAGRYRVGPGRYRLAVDLEGLALGEIGFLDRLPSSLRPEGRVEVDLRGRGTTDSPTLAGDVQWRSVELGGRKLGDVALVANTVDDVLYLSGAALPLGTLNFEIPLDGRSDYHARFGLENLDFASVFPEVRRLSIVDHLTATGVVDLALDRDFEDYLVSVDLRGVRLETPNETIRTRGPVRASLDSNRRLQIAEATIGSRGQYVDLKGGVLLESQLISMEVDGDVDLALLEVVERHLVPGLLPESVVDARGVVNVSAEIGGPPTRPVPKGSLTFRGVSVKLRGFSEPFRVHRGRIAFDRESIRVSQESRLQGEFLGGVYNAFGELGVDDYRLQGGQFQVWTHDMLYRLPETAKVSFGTDLTIRAEDVWRPETWLVAGSVEVVSASYYRDVSLFEEQLTGRFFGAFDRRTERYEAGLLEQFPWAGEISFDVDIRARDGVRIESQIDRFALDLELRLDLEVEQRLADPRLTGEIDVISGTVGFQGEQFDVRNGVIQYTGNPNNPRIAITADADIRNRCVETEPAEELTESFQFAGDFDESRRGDVYHVILNVEGKLDTLNIQFESNPYADQRDILSLLLTGCTVDELTASTATQPTLEIALGPLLGRLEREVRSVVQLSEFTIMPGVERTQVRLGDEVSRRLEWRFRLDTGVSERAGGQRYQLEYRLSDRWSVEVSERSRGETESLLLDARLKYRLPLD